METIGGFTNCTEQVELSVETNSGYGASTGMLLSAFFHAYKDSNKAFQIVDNPRRWLYATADKSSWAYCEAEDTRCYYLPINPCPRKFDIWYQLFQTKPRNSNEKKLHHWMRHYLFRPKQHFRYQLFMFRKQHFQSQNYQPCTLMHVRRGDAGLPRPPFRRYAPVQEYIDKANIQPGDNIVLLTDDDSTIVEIKKFLATKYNWIYLDRPRVQNIKGGFDGHIPSGDEAYEMLVIHTEMSVGSSCNKVVHGQSGFINGLISEMYYDGKNYTTYYVETAISKSEAQKFATKEDRVKSLLDDVYSVYNQTNNISAVVAR